MILGVIPARGGSKGLPKKNIKLLLGKPVVGYTIEIAQKSKKLDRLVVSTEDPEIVAVSRRFGVEVVKRPSGLAKDSSNIDGALKHTVETVEKEGKNVEIVVWLQANVPIRGEDVVDKVIDKLINTGADSVKTMSPVRWPLEKACKIIDNCIVPYWGTWAKNPRRQDCPEAYIPDGAVYAIKRNVLMQVSKPGDSFDYFFGKSRVAYVQTKFEHGIEIDDEEEFVLAEMFLERQQLKD
jgi:N-acylneuraminate cytidylyltransferase